MDTIRKSDDNFIFAGDVKICRVDKNNRLVFFDKNRQRSRGRGSKEVVVHLLDLARVLKE